MTINNWTSVTIQDHCVSEGRHVSTAWHESKEHEAKRLREWAAIDAMSPEDYEKWLDSQVEAARRQASAKGWY